MREAVAAASRKSYGNEEDSDFLYVIDEEGSRRGDGDVEIRASEQETGIEIRASEEETGIEIRAAEEIEVFGRDFRFRKRV